MTIPICYLPRSFYFQIPKLRKIGQILLLATSQVLNSPNIANGREACAKRTKEGLPPAYSCPRSSRTFCRTYYCADLVKPSWFFQKMRELQFLLYESCSVQSYSRDWGEAGGWYWANTQSCARIDSWAIIFTFKK